MKISEMGQHLNQIVGGTVDQAGTGDDNPRPSHPGAGPKSGGPEGDPRPSHPGAGPKSGGPEGGPQASHPGAGPKSGGPGEAHAQRPPGSGHTGGPAAPADGVDRADAEKLRQLLDNPIFGARPRP